ncbi:MAG TPA: PAS domain-containing protein, partial [Candidatus Kapabacteria bacterium]|nr:PAS domain-containing protein [Candidatus Kapabacteria bacterium]
MKILLLTTDPSSVEPVLQSAGHTCTTTTTTTALKRIGKSAKIDCVVISCESEEALSIWQQGLQEFCAPSPSVVVSHADQVLELALRKGAAQACSVSTIGLLPAMVERACKIGTLERATEDLLDRVLSLEEDNTALVDNVIDVITVLDIKGNITYESPSIKRALGYEQPELIGRNAFSLIHPLDVPRVLPVFMLGVATPGSPLAAKFRFRNAEGGWSYLESLGKAVNTSKGLRVMVTSRIVTEKAHLTTLGETETRFMNVVEALGEGLFIIGKDSRINYVNSRMTQLSGYTQEELIDSVAKELLIAQDEWALFDQSRTLALNGKSDEIEIQLKRKNGASLWIMM